MPPVWKNDVMSTNAAILEQKTVDRQIDPVAERVVEKIAAEVRPEKIYLFGSRASGVAGPESDVDILLVHAGEETPREIRLKTHQLFPRPSFSLDVFVLSSNEFEAQRRVPNTLAREVSETGILCDPLRSKVGRPRRGRRAVAGGVR